MPSVRSKGYQHTSVFLLAGILRLLNLLLPSAFVGYVDLLIVPYGLYYGMTSLRVYYQQSLRWTWFKFLSLMVVYLMLLVTVMLLTGTVSIL